MAKWLGSLMRCVFVCLSCPYCIQVCHQWFHQLIIPCVMIAHWCVYCFVEWRENLGITTYHHKSQKKGIPALPCWVTSWCYCIHVCTVCVCMHTYTHTHTLIRQYSVFIWVRSGIPLPHHLIMTQYINVKHACIYTQYSLVGPLSL